jgi:hypothetical protein
MSNLVKASKIYVEVNGQNIDFDVYSNKDGDYWELRKEKEPLRNWWYEPSITAMKNCAFNIWTERIKMKVPLYPPDVIELAELLHKRLCHWNHTDGCSWEYEDWSNLHGNSARCEFAKKAEKILKVTDLKTMKSVLKII